MTLSQALQMPSLELRAVRFSRLHESGHHKQHFALSTPAVTGKALWIRGTCWLTRLAHPEGMIGEGEK